MQEQLTIFDTSKYTNFSGIQGISKTQDFPYIHCEEQIPLDLKQGSFISITRKKPLKIHHLGFQPAKTIPEIPRWFLNKYGYYWQQSDLVSKKFQNFLAKMFFIIFASILNGGLRRDCHVIDLSHELKGRLTHPTLKLFQIKVLRNYLYFTPRSNCIIKFFC